MVALAATCVVALLQSLHIGPISGSTAAPGCPAPDAQPFSLPELRRADGPPQADANSTSKTTARARPGDTVRYTCDPGRALVGLRQRRCQQEGSWTAAAPHCYLNLAEGSELSVSHPHLVDGNLSTFETLNKGVLETTFYSVTPQDAEPSGSVYAHEVRIVTDGDTSLSDWAVKLQYDSSSLEISLKNFAVEQLQSYREYSGDFHRDGRSGSLQGLTLLNRSGRREEVKVNELQVLGLSIDRPGGTGRISVHQCTLQHAVDGLLRTWTDGARCYHLVEAAGTNTDAAAAEDRCRTLGARGTLARLSSTQLHAMVQDILRHESIKGQWSEEHVLVAGRRESNSTPWMLEKEEWTAAEHIANTKLKTVGCAILKQIAKWFVEAWVCDDPVNKLICQTDPEICGSPGRALGVRLYPEPSHQARAANVTCPGHDSAAGQIVCQGRLWTQPTFCQSADLGAILGGVAAVLVLLLVGCGLLLVLRRHRRKVDAATPAWAPYEFLHRLNRLSRRYSRGHRRPRPAARPEQDEEHIYSEVVYADPGDSGYEHDSKPGAESPARVKSWLHGPTDPAHSGMQAVDNNPLYETSTAARLTSLNEYSLPLVNGTRLLDSGSMHKLRLPDMSKDGTAVAISPAPGGEYAVPYNTGRQLDRMLSTKL